MRERLARGAFEFPGSDVARALADRGEPAHRVALAGLPVGEVEGQRQYAPEGDLLNALIVHGENDDRVLLTALLDWARPRHSPIVFLPGADHFFTGPPVLRSLVLSHITGSP
jgi:alpha/beta superfamily hydrolase